MKKLLFIIVMLVSFGLYGCDAEDIIRWIPDELLEDTEEVKDIPLDNPVEFEVMELAEIIEPEPAYSELINEVITGVSYALVTIASVIGLYRSIKKPLTASLDTGASTLKDLKTAIEKVASGETTIESFIASDMPKFLGDMRGLLTEGLSNLSIENKALKDEVLRLTNEFQTMYKMVEMVFKSEDDIKEILKIAFLNDPRLVAEGWANEIAKVGVTTNESET